MNYSIIAPIAISLPILLSGCASNASNVQTKEAAAAAPVAKVEKMAKKEIGCTTALSFASATDDGTHEDGRPPSKTIDGNLDSESRWSSKSEGSPKTITLKLGSTAKIGAVGIAWLKGDERASTFSIETSTDGKSFSEVVATKQSSGSSKGIEQYKFAPTDAQYVRVNANGNEKNKWNSIVEAKAFGC